MREHDYEPIHGLPEALPPGETVLWQGRPTWKTLAVRAFHLRGLTIYFGVLVAYAVISKAVEGGTPLEVGRSLGIFGGLAAAVIGMIALFAYMVARTTIYTITNRRVVLRFGVALPLTVNFPFTQLIAGSLRMHGGAGPGASGDIALALREGKRTSYILLWPHARPWRMSRPEPMMRAIPDAAKVAQVLARAAAAAAPDSLQVTIGATGNSEAQRIGVGAQVAAA
jgi:hypothetical protein